MFRSIIVFLGLGLGLIIGGASAASADVTFAQCVSITDDLRN